MAAAKQKPASVAVSNPLEARVAQLEQQLQALFSLTVPTVLEGKTVPRCSQGCRRLSTRTLVIDHPVEGQHSLTLCDDCQPDHPIGRLAQARHSTRHDFSQESLKRIRHLNEALKCVPS